MFRFYVQVKSVLIPRPPAIGVGKVLVEFDDVRGCLDAQSVLQGRKFASRIVEAKFFSEELYHARLL